MLFISLCLFSGLAVSLGINQGLSTPRPVVVDAQQSPDTLLMGEVGGAHLLLSRTESRTFESSLVRTPISFSEHDSVDALVRDFDR